MHFHLSDWPRVLGTLLSFVLLSRAQDNRPVDPKNHFISPPVPGPQYNVDATVYYTNKNWTIGSPQNVVWNWVTNRTNLGIIMYQEGNSEIVKAHTILDCPGASTTDNIYWDGQISPIDLSVGNIVFLGAIDCDTQSSPLFFSHYFNLTEPVSSSSSSSSSTTTSSSSSSSTGSALASAATNTSPSSTGGSDSAASTSTTTPAADTSKSSSNTTALAGGIGGGIGGALLILGIVGLVLWHRRNKKKDRLRNTEAAAGAGAGTSHSSYYASTMSPDKGSDNTAWGGNTYRDNNSYRDVPMRTVPGELEANSPRGGTRPVDYNTHLLSRSELDSTTSNSHSR